MDQPKGSLYGPSRTTTLQTNDQILTPEDWNNQIIAYRNGGPIRVSDVGKAIVGPQDTTLMGWVNLKRGIVLAIQRLPGANVISTVDAIKAALPQLEASIPPSIKVSVIADRTTTIRASVADVQFTLDPDDRAGRRRDLRVPAEISGQPSYRPSPCRCRSSARSV